MLDVVAAAVLGPAGLLLVSKRAAPEVFYLPGGKSEPDESAEGTLRRELREELGVEIRAAQQILDFCAPAALETGVEMRMRVFRTDIVGEPTAAAEIACLAWWPQRRDLELAPAVRDHVLPAFEMDLPQG